VRSGYVFYVSFCWNATDCVNTFSLHARTFLMLDSLELHLVAFSVRLLYWEGMCTKTSLF
jgi:hypothetical protein